MVHAENHDVISWLADKMLAAGHSAPRFHAMAHAPIAEREATSRAISLAEFVDVPILIVHVSAREAMEQNPPGEGARPQGLRRDLPAIPFPHRQ